MPTRIEFESPEVVFENGDLAAALNRLKLAAELEIWKVFLKANYVVLKKAVSAGPHEQLVCKKCVHFPHTVRGFIDNTSEIPTLSILVGKISGIFNFKVLKKGIEIQNGEFRLIAIARPNFKRLRNLQQDGFFSEDYGGLEKDFTISNFLCERRVRHIIPIRRVSYHSKTGELRFKNIMPLCDEDLFEKVIRLYNGAVEPSVVEKKEILAYFVQLFECLMDMHEQQIVHLDLKLENFLVLGKQLYVIDFGNTEKVGQAVSKIGTVGYMAPELLMHPFQKLVLHAPTS